MADGKFFLTKIRELLIADTTLGTLMGTVRVKIAEMSPVGNQYPQISLYMDEGRSEQIIPAGHYKLEVTIWADEKKEAYKFLQQAKARVNAIVNRKASSLSEINLTTNKGLRVAKSLKTGGQVDFNEEVGKYFIFLPYDVVLSEDEDFSANTINDWV